MNKREIANFIHQFVEWKYHDLIAYKEIENAVIYYPDSNKYGFNCHAVLEKYGIGIDQFKKDFVDLLLIFNRTPPINKMRLCYEDVADESKANFE